MKDKKLICIAHFKGSACSKDCQWYLEDSKCPNYIIKPKEIVY